MYHLSCAIRADVRLASLPEAGGSALAGGCGAETALLLPFSSSRTRLSSDCTSRSPRAGRERRRARGVERWQGRRRQSVRLKGWFCWGQLSGTGRHPADVAIADVPRPTATDHSPAFDCAVALFSAFAVVQPIVSKHVVSICTRYTMTIYM